MLPTAEGGKANAWLRQKNAGIYVRPRLFSPYVEEAKVWLIHFWLMELPDNAGSSVLFVYHIAIIEERFCEDRRTIKSLQEICGPVHSSDVLK